MKNLMKAFGIALLLSGVFAVTNVSAQTAPAQATPAKTTAPAKNMDKVLGKDAKGNTVYKGAKGNYYIMNGKNVMEPKDAKITPVAKTTTPAPTK
jgi:hypothetical protein